MACRGMPILFCRGAFIDEQTYTGMTYTFTGLQNGVEYTFCVTATNVNGTSEPATVKATPRAPYHISLSETGVYSFAAATVGYGAQTALTVTVYNIGTQATGALSVGLSGTDAADFTLSTTSITDITAGGSDNFTLVPNTGLAIGTYTATVTVELQNNQNITVTGETVDPATTSIAINSGFNWIGYTPGFPLEVNVALAGISALTGDQLKSQTGYSIRLGTNWIGSLTDMEPGKGYIYQTEYPTPQTLTYPSVAPLGAALHSKAATYLSVTQKWQSDGSRYPDNMTVTSIAINGDDEVRNSQLEIAAFSENEVRGSAILQYIAELDKYIGFLLVTGENGETITLKAFDHATGEEYDTHNALTFASNAIYGNLLNPYPVALTSTTTGMSKIVSQISIYPNPVKGRLYISRTVETFDLVEIIDLNGRSVLLQKDFNAASINVSALETGMYLIRITAGKETVVKRFIKR